MDAYSAPYCPKFRYWTGLLLLARVILYLVSALNPSKEPRVNFVAIMVVICSLLALSAFQVYKRWFLNTIEVATYYNLILVSIFQLVASENNSSTASYISAAISFATLLCIVCYHTFTMILIRRWLLNSIRSCLLEGDNSESDDAIRGQHVATHTEVTFQNASEQN